MEKPVLEPGMMSDVDVNAEMKMALLMVFLMISWASLIPQRLMVRSPLFHSPTRSWMTR